MYDHTSIVSDLLSPADPTQGSRLMVKHLVTPTLSCHHLTILFKNNIFICVVEEKREVTIGGGDTARSLYPRGVAAVVHDALDGGVIGGVEVLAKRELTLTDTLVSVVTLRGNYPRRPSDHLKIYQHVASLTPCWHLRRRNVHRHRPTNAVGGNILVPSLS